MRAMHDECARCAMVVVIVRKCSIIVRLLCTTLYDYVMAAYYSYMYVYVPPVVGRCSYPLRPVLRAYFMAYNMNQVYDNMSCECIVLRSYVQTNECSGLYDGSRTSVLSYYLVHIQ